MVTSLQLSPFGLNFHHSCHHGIIMEERINMSIKQQAIGRI